MKKISEMVNIGHPSNESRKPLLNEGLVEKVWTAGAVIFGDKWIHKHGELPGGEWSNVFLAFDQEQIAKGVQRMMKDAEHKIKIGDEAWPPSAFEFACYCKTPSSLYFHSPMQLEHKGVSTPEVAQENIAAMKKKLRN